MPDGVAITAGSGTTVATDDAGAAGHVQIFKLAVSADGSATLIPGDAANGMDVDVTREPATAADNAASLPAVVKVMAGWDGTNVQALKTNAAGEMVTSEGPATSGGLTASKLISAATTNATVLKASAGQLYGGMAYNLNAAVRYLRFYNTASSPTVGTTATVLLIPIPPGSGVLIPGERHGIAFSTGIAYALTTGVADTDTGAVAANEIIVNLLYK